MNCRKCAWKIEGEMKMKLERDRIDFYHPDCYPKDTSPDLVSDENQEAIAKSLIALAILLGKMETGQP